MRLSEAVGAAKAMRGYCPVLRQPYCFGRTDSLAEAQRIGEEVETLYTNGPAAGGGAWKAAREVVGVASALIPEAAARTAVTIVETSRP